MFKFKPLTLLKKTMEQLGILLSKFNIWLKKACVSTMKVNTLAKTIKRYFHQRTPKKPQRLC